MAYQKQNWQNGERVVASKLNHIEDGLEGIQTEINEPSGVIAGTYGNLGPATTYVNIRVPRFTVQEDGRITSANEDDVPIIRAVSTSIAAGNTTATASIAFSTTSTSINKWFNVLGFTVVTNGKTETCTPLLCGTDFTYYWIGSTVYITLTNALTETAYFKIYGTVSTSTM